MQYPYGNTYYPATYQSPLQMPMQYQQYGQNMQSNQYSQAPMQYSQQQNDLNWVQGEIGAKAFPSPAAGHSTILMDSEEQRFFIKSTDVNGMPLPLRSFTYTEEAPTPKSYDKSGSEDYTTRKEFEEYIQSMRDTNTEVIVPQKSARREKNAD